MRSRFPRLGAILCLCLFFCCPSPASAQDFTITDFTANITVKPDSSFRVTESITVEFHRPRHGIYRDIPYRYTDSFGSTITTPTHDFSVTDASGSSLKHKIIRQGNVMRVRIGDPDRYVSGTQQYDITYTVENAILFFDDHDELYWNVTGNEWEAAIRKSRCMVKLEGAKTKQYWASCYTGISGSREAACRSIPGDNFIEFIGQRPLNPGEGLTIAYGWDKGIVSPPSTLKKLLWKLNLVQNWVFILPVIAFVIMLMHWLRSGRDPRVRESVTVMYGPPLAGEKPLSPAAVGTMVDEKLDPRDITATIVGLAVKGYIKIEETKKEGIIFDSTDHFLRRLREPDTLLSSFERQLMQDIFGVQDGKMISDLKNTFYTKIPSLKTTLFDELIRLKYFTSNPETVRTAYTVAAGVVGIAVTFLLHVLLGNVLGDVRPLVTGALSGLAVFAFARNMPAKTREGASVYMQILGFQEFMNRAEKDQLERMKDENLFSRFFPYALALDVADNWAKAFEGIYQTQPEWYSSPGGMRTFNPIGFNRSFGSAVAGMSTAIYSSPRGSGAGGGGSFGGGSSGGGFGGGGGGSW